MRSIQRLQDALKKLSPEQVEAALQNMKMNQEQVMRSLERTIEMLKQIRTEEKMEAASERAAEMERRQIALNDSLSRAKNSEETRSLEKGQRENEKLSARRSAPRSTRWRPISAPWIARRRRNPSASRRSWGSRGPSPTSRR